MSSNLGQFKVVVVGAGFFGATVAYCVATELDRPVLVVEKRPYLGGNAHSERDLATDIECHTYGSHLFHTSSARIWAFINRFSGFNTYRHRVFARHGDAIYTLPVNLMTINALFGSTFTPDEARALIADAAAREGVAHPTNLEEKAISLMGRRLYEAFIRNYTLKQWGTDPTNLPPHIITRLPIRFTFNDAYFDDKYQGVPLDGYGTLFARMLDHPKIECRLSCDFFEIKRSLANDAVVVYTGPIDRLFNYQYGVLGWRTLDFQRERLALDDYQGTAVMNYPDLAFPFTRIHEFKHLHPERRAPGRTVIVREYSRAASRSDEPFYPIGTAADRDRLAQYQALAKAEPRLILGGRLASYRYLDMDQVVGAALKCFTDEIFAVRNTLIAERLTELGPHLEAMKAIACRPSPFEAHPWWNYGHMFELFWLHLFGAPFVSMPSLRSLVAKGNGPSVQTR